MKISVVIPVYRDFERLLICLQALENQALEKNLFEVIVINNDPDQLMSKEDFPEYSYTLRVEQERKPGSYAARNMGLNIANNEIIGFTDSDCVPDTKWLKSAFNIFQKDLNKEIGIVSGPVPLFFKQLQKFNAAEIYEKYTGFDFEAYTKSGSCGAGNWFSYKERLIEFDGFDENLKSNGDTELSGRISERYSVIYNSDIIVKHPARDSVRDIVFKYRRLLGGVFLRKYKDRPLRFAGHVIWFAYRRMKFALKKLFTKSPFESLPITVVCMRISWGACLEYLALVSGADTKR
ncbi:glycosyltransferase [Algoriphagus halophytocola]|uniref:Glycosyltransferase n=1 Tax=Algoriphagus halophytocola TaxID=2991499 RepID=A0ABY6MLC2_9BACT|nr:glycosyltransferase [Algoriphagus sp. TR-M5]UZD23935.1 glycosyltransferase [Algoriphagus sp. TR-M5]